MHGRLQHLKKLNQRSKQLLIFHNLPELFHEQDLVVVVCHMAVSHLFAAKINGPERVVFAPLFYSLLSGIFLFVACSCFVPASVQVVALLCR